jgi:hypothetical protein
MQGEYKTRQRRFKFMRLSHVAQKTKFRGLQIESVIGPLGLFGHPQAYKVHWIDNAVVLLHSLSKKLNTTFSHICFLWGDISRYKNIMLDVIKAPNKIWF